MRYFQKVKELLIIDPNFVQVALMDTPLGILPAVMVYLKIKYIFVTTKGEGLPQITVVSIAFLC